MGWYGYLLKKKESLKGELFPRPTRAFLRLDDEGMRLALRVAREALERFLRKDGAAAGEAAAVPESFGVPVTLDVALWVDGALRGSQIVVEKPLGQAIVEAARRSAVDSRFKPLALEEMERLRIEVTLVVGEYATLTRSDLKHGSIDPSLGYRLTYQGRIGWFYPEVFNCLRFRSLVQLVDMLAVNKAGLSREVMDRATVETFEVQDFIESADLSRALVLAGPFVRSLISYESIYTSGFSSDLEACMRAAADQLCRIQEADGNIPPIIEMLTGKETQFDPVRLMCTAEALAHAGEALSEKRYSDAATRAVAYAAVCADGQPSEGGTGSMLAEVYRAKTLHALGQAEEAEHLASRVVSRIDTVPYMPIAHLQAASLLSSFGPGAFSDAARKIFDRCFDDYARRMRIGGDIELALFPEAIVVAEKLHRISGDAMYRRKATELSEWLKGCQLPDGSFPAHTSGGLAYTRGTGKIFEVLATDSKKHERALLAVFRWIRDIQYTEENAFFVSKRYQSRLLGGFRHDALNQDVWIDASAHVLLGGARVLRHLKEDRT